ncbi:MAG: hypothetical protein AAF224_06115 [Pseudomonadota bacterium]
MNDAARATPDRQKSSAREVSKKSAEKDGLSTQQQGEDVAAAPSDRAPKASPHADASPQNSENLPPTHSGNHTPHHAAEDKPRGATIEGGVDAIIVGAPLDGLAAAALLARSGLRVVIVESGMPMTAPEPEEFAPQFFCDVGDTLFFGLDQAVLQRLDLYRHGLRFAARRMSTSYWRTPQSRFAARGDVSDLATLKGDVADADRRRADAITEEILSLGKSLRPYFETGRPPDHFGALFDHWALTSLDEALAGVFSENPFTDILTTEASRGVGVRPDAPMSAFSLVRRFAGEIAGLQSGVGAVDRGARGLARALRRAGQGANVDYRYAVQVERVLIEWDRVAGVEFTNGGQIRAPIVISCYPPRAAFLDHIGRDHLNIEFIRAIETAASRPVMVAAHLAFAEKSDSPLFKDDYKRRNIRLASLEDLKRAHRMARAGRFCPEAPGELFFPTAFNDALAPTAGATGVLRLWPAPPAPQDKDGKRRWRLDAEDAVRAALNAFDDKAADALCAIKIVEEESADVILREAALARLTADAGGLAGYFYCGSGAQIGLFQTGAAGRRAADDALRYHRHLQDTA